MIFISKNRNLTAVLALSAILLTGCAMGRKTVFYHLNPEGKIDQKTLERLLWENELGANQNVSSSIILTTDMASVHLVQVRTQEEPHLHQYHDSVAFMESGTGRLFLGDQSIPVKAGSVVFVPYGTPHYFVNTGPEPAVIIAVFSPPYDGKDRVPVTIKSHKW
jgi:mannose-6-phosphate isomerase-like protein (cupin superfamily)